MHNAASHSAICRRRSTRRRGASLVELAVVLPVFGIFMAGIIEVNHAYMVNATLREAAQQAARSGVADGVTTDDVKAKARSLLSAAINPAAVTVFVKDGSGFDSGAVDPSTVKYSTLPNIELASAAPRQLYIVRIEVNYEDVALMPPFFVKNQGGTAGRLSGQSVMRHE